MPLATSNHKIPLKFSGLGLILILSLGVLLALVHRFVNSPALLPRADGTYGEMYGPVSALKGPFYLLLLCAALLVLCLFFIRNRVNETNPEA